MNLQKLGQSLLQLAITFSGILQIGLDQAASILASFDWNIQKAIASIDLQQKQEQKKREDVEKKEDQSKLKKEAEIKKENKKYLIQDEIKNESKSIIGNRQKQKQQKISVFSQIRQRKQHQQQPKINMRLGSKQVFLSYIINKYHPLINFAFDDFDQLLKRSFKERKYVLVYVHHIDDLIEKRYQVQVEEIMVNKDIVRFINNYCIAFGVIYDSPEYTKIAEFFSQNKDKPMFGLFQFNHIRSKIEFISQYDPKAEDLNFLEWLSMNADINVSGQILTRVGERFSQLKLRGKHQKNHQQQQLLEENQWKGSSRLYDFGFKEDNPSQSNYYDSSKYKRKSPSKIDDYSWKKQKLDDNESKISSSLIDRLKLDNKIKEQQDAAYQKMQKSYIRKREISQLQHKQSKFKDHERQAKEKQWQQRRKKLENQFEQELDADSIKIKFRLPDGKSFIHIFSMKDQVQKLFIYVDLFCRDHFQQKYSQFELTLNYSDIQLEKIKKQEIKKVFEGQNGGVIIIVKQI